MPWEVVFVDELDPRMQLPAARQPERRRPALEGAAPGAELRAPGGGHGRPPARQGRRRDDPGRRPAGPARGAVALPGQVEGGVRRRLRRAPEAQGRPAEARSATSSSTAAWAVWPTSRSPTTRGTSASSTARWWTSSTPCPSTTVFVRGLRAWAGHRQMGLEYERQRREGGETSYTLAKLVRLAVDGVFSFSTAPLRLATWMGVLLILTAGAGHPCSPGGSSASGSLASRRRSCQAGPASCCC